MRHLVEESDHLIVGPPAGLIIGLAREVLENGSYGERIGKDQDAMGVNGHGTDHFQIMSFSTM
jgi:hypothetical protein